VYLNSITNLDNGSLRYTEELPTGDERGVHEPEHQRKDFVATFC